MLVALASAKRASSLNLLSVKKGFCEISESLARFQPIDLEKNENMSHTGQPLVLEKFTEDPRLCPVAYLRAYIARTKTL